MKKPAPNPRKNSGPKKGRKPNFRRALAIARREAKLVAKTPLEKLKAQREKREAKAVRKPVRLATGRQLAEERQSLGQLALGDAKPALPPGVETTDQELKPAGKSLRRALSIAKGTAKLVAKSPLEKLKARRAKAEAGSEKRAAGKADKPLAEMADAEMVAASVAAETRLDAKRRAALPPGVEVIDGDALAFHALCELLPRMSLPELASLREDIRANGQRDPIVLLNGKILDGRNRYLACCEMERPYAVRQFDPAKDGDPLAYIVSKATHRNMDDTQKACASVNILDAFAAEAEKRMRAGKANPEAPVPQGSARDQAGAMFGVSGRYVQSAKLLKESAPDLFDKCFNGHEVLTRAVREHKRRAKKDDLTEKAKAANANRAGDRFELHCGDSLVVLPTLDVVAPLVFLDPKYDLGRSYGDNADGVEVDDKLGPAAYGKWLASLLEASAAKVSEDGSIAVMIHARWQALVYFHLDMLGFHWRGTPIWQYGFGMSRSSHSYFTPSYVPIVHFSRQPKRHLFNGESILVKSKRNLPVVCPTCSARSGYDDARGNPDGKVMDDVFDVPRLVDNAPERMPGSDNQVPLAVMTPLILALTDPGDMVLDPCNGWGSTGHAAVINGRRYVGIDIVPDQIDVTRDRLTAAQADYLQRPDLNKKERKSA